ncbi:MAG: secondary thiamine-phosphate synthase enzyme YjbQ [Candidatus Altiarchaeota archaeon]
MKVVTRQIQLNTKPDLDIIDITCHVSDAVKGSKLRSGTVTIFVPGSTGSVSTMEYEPGLLKDIPRALEQFAPSGIDYAHHRTWGDDNGKSHVRATIMGPSLTVPFVDGKLTLGTWQQIVFLDFDTPSRSRNLIVQIMGE